MQRRHVFRFCPMGVARTRQIAVRQIGRAPIRMREFEELYHLEVAMWSKPEYSEMRFGFEVTMYIANR